MRQDGLGLIGVMIGDVKQAQARLGSMAWQGHLRAQLGDDEASSHLPLRMRGMAKRKQTHEMSLVLVAAFLVAAFWVAAFLAVGFLAVAGGTSFMAFAATSLTAAAAIF